VGELAAGAGLVCETVTTGAQTEVVALQQSLHGNTVLQHASLGRAQMLTSVLPDGAVSEALADNGVPSSHSRDGRADGSTAAHFAAAQCVANGSSPTTPAAAHGLHAGHGDASAATVVGRQLAMRFSYELRQAVAARRQQRLATQVGDVIVENSPPGRLEEDAQKDRDEAGHQATAAQVVGVPVAPVTTPRHAGAAAHQHQQHGQQRPPRARANSRPHDEDATPGFPSAAAGAASDVQRVRHEASPHTLLLDAARHAGAGAGAAPEPTTALPDARCCLPVEGGGRPSRVQGQLGDAASVLVSILCNAPPPPWGGAPAGPALDTDLDLDVVGDCVAGKRQTTRPQQEEAGAPRQPTGSEPGGGTDASSQGSPRYPFTWGRAGDARCEAATLRPSGKARCMRVMLHCALPIWV
jgi:hypothetical protein